VATALRRDAGGGGSRGAAGPARRRARVAAGPGSRGPRTRCPPSTAGAGYSVCHVRRITATTSGHAVRVSRACRGPDSTPFRLPAPVPSPFSSVGSWPAGSRSGAGVRQAAGPARIRSEIVSANDGSDTATGWGAAGRVARRDGRRRVGLRDAATTAPSTTPSLPRSSRTCARRLVRDPGGPPADIEVRVTTLRRCTSAWNAPVRQPTGPCLQRPPPRGRPVRRVTVRPRMSRRIGAAAAGAKVGGSGGAGGRRRRSARRRPTWRPVQGLAAPGGTAATLRRSEAGDRVCCCAMSRHMDEMAA